MIRYFLLSITCCLMFLTNAVAQQPSYGYRFKLIDANGKFITDADSLFQISSIRSDGSIYKHINYGHPNGAKSPNYDTWWLDEYYTDIRKFHLIQILNKKSLDTMTFFYRKNSKYQTYPEEDNLSLIDTIRFSKGYYILHERPLLKDWDIKSKSGKLTLLSKRQDFFRYVAMKTNIVQSDTMKNVLYASNRGGEAETPAPINLSRFVNLIVPVNMGRKTGRIVVRFIVDSDGKVIEATPAVKGTTLSDNDLNQKCKEAMMKSRLLASDKPIQSGTVVFSFK